MIQLNPRYDTIFNPDNIDQDCDGIASLMNIEADFIKEALDAGLYKHTTRITSSTCFRHQTSFIGLWLSFIHKHINKKLVNNTKYKQLEEAILNATDLLIEKAKSQGEKALYNLFKSAILKK